MCSKGFVKRIVPFFLTFALGLLVASFFVSVALPNFSFPNRGWGRHQQYHQKMEFENQQLKEKVSRLEKQLTDKNNLDFQNLDLDVPPPALRAVPHRR
jgi:hypothetical protein